MTKRLTLSCLVFAMVFSSGCLFSRKSAKTKESSTWAGEVEETFKRRWIDKRIAELSAQGIGPEPARAQATREFDEKFAFAEREKK
jgi:hypothetical protein